MDTSSLDGACDSTLGGLDNWACTALARRDCYHPRLFSSPSGNLSLRGSPDVETAAKAALNRLNFNGFQPLLMTQAANAVAQIVYCTATFSYMFRIVYPSRDFVKFLYYLVHFIGRMRKLGLLRLLSLSQTA